MYNKKRKVYITGINGSLGSELNKIFQINNIEVNGHQRNPKNFDNDNLVFGDINDEKTQNNIINHFISTKSNVLINNAGLYVQKPLNKITDEEVKNLIGVNLTSPIIITKKIIDFLVLNGGGMIYNINSIAGINSTVNESLYCASKFGLKGFTDSLIQEYKNNNNIRIVNVTLGGFKSKMTEKRKNYSVLSEPNEIANKIYSHIMEDYKTINTDLTIYRK